MSIISYQTGKKILWELELKSFGLYCDGENLCAVQYLGCGMAIWPRFTVCLKRKENKEKKNLKTQSGQKRWYLKMLDN